MTVDSNAYALENAAWVTVAAATGSAGLNASATNHAERYAFNKLKTVKTSTTYCTVTNAFPCQYCLNFFLTWSKNNAGGRVALKCTANESGDGAPYFQQNKFNKGNWGTLYVMNEMLYMALRKIVVTRKLSGSNHAVDGNGSNSYKVDVSFNINGYVPIPADVTNNLPALP